MAPSVSKTTALGSDPLAKLSNATRGRPEVRAPPGGEAVEDRVELFDLRARP